MSRQYQKKQHLLDQIKEMLASAKYQKEHIASVACRLKKEQAEAFKRYCESQGKTPNAVLREYILDCLETVQKKVDKFSFP